MANATPNNLVNMVILSVGAVANASLLYSLVKKPPISRLTRVLTMWQFCADGLTCSVGFLNTLSNVLTTPASFTTDSVVWASITCYLWRNYVATFVFVYFATHNLICLGLDRYWALCRPVTYKNNHGRCLLFCWMFNCAASVELLCTLPTFNMLVNSTVCISRPPSITHRICPVLWFAINWLLTSLALLTIYSRVAHEVLTRGRQHRQVAPVDPTESQRRRNFSREMLTMTMAMVVMSVVFCCFFSVSRVGLFLNSLGLVDYVFGTPKQLIGASLVWASSALTPIVYMATIPRQRKRIVLLLLSVCCKRVETDTHDDTNVSVTGE